MENQNDKYQYFSGDAKRILMEFDGKMQLNELKNETHERLNALHSELVDDDAMYIAKFLEETHNKSVKPGVKTPFKKKKVELSKKALAVGACAFMIAGGLGTITTINIVKNVSTKIEQQKVINNDMEDFRKKALIPNTHIRNVVNSETLDKTTVHWHDFTDIIMNAKQKSENPIVTFYMLYNSLDEYCRNTQVSTIMEDFNRIYGTDYMDLNDFLEKNGFANEEEWKVYVANALIDEQEEHENGYSNLGR